MFRTFVPLILLYSLCAACTSSTSGASPDSTPIVDAPSGDVHSGDGLPVDAVIVDGPAIDTTRADSARAVDTRTPVDAPRPVDAPGPVDAPAPADRAVTSDTGTSCKALETGFAAAHKVAKSCVPGKGECTHKQTGLIYVMCACPQFFNAGKKAELARMATLRSQFVAKRCSGPVCRCANPTSATCKASPGSPVGTCVDK